MSQEDYNKNFCVSGTNQEKLKAAFSQVSDIRKFEIGLYWTRATYFWALIAVTFGGYFAIYSADRFDNQFLLTMIIGSFGLVVTVAWHLANRGSKYWQENWENHLDLLEDNITGPLYKTLLERPNFDSITDKWITGPLSVSVSKINQWVSVYVIFTWVILILLAGYKSLKVEGLNFKQCIMVAIHLTVPASAFICCLLMFFQGKTHMGKHTTKMIQRVTQIKECI